MRQLIVTGRLGADAELRQTQQGRSYFTCRLANNEYGDEEGVTHWYRVVSYNQIYIKNVANFKKGSSVIIVGRYDDHTYQTKNGTIEISRDIVANSIDYNNTGRSNSNNEDETHSVENNTPKQTSRPNDINMKPFSNPVNNNSVASNTQTTNVTVDNSEDDDLPF